MHLAFEDAEEAAQHLEEVVHGRSHTATDVISVDLTGARLAGRALATLLDAMPQLRELSALRIDDCGLCPANAAYLLRAAASAFAAADEQGALLSAAGNAMDAGVLQRLPPMPTLTSLDLSRTPIDDGALPLLVARCPNLRSLRLNRTPVSDPQPLFQLPDLRVLSLDHTNVGDAADVCMVEMRARMDKRTDFELRVRGVVLGAAWLPLIALCAKPRLGVSMLHDMQHFGAMPRYLSSLHAHVHVHLSIEVGVRHYVRLDAIEDRVAATRPVLDVAEGALFEVLSACQGETRRRLRDRIAERRRSSYQGLQAIVAENHLLHSDYTLDTVQAEWTNIFNGQRRTQWLGLHDVLLGPPNEWDLTVHVVLARVSV